MRDLAILVVLVVLAWAVYSLRSVTAPMLIGMVMAYICNPILTHAQKKWNLPRSVSALAILSIVVLVGLAFLWWAVPMAATQVINLVDHLPNYLTVVGKKLKPDFNWDQLFEHLKQMQQNAKTQLQQGQFDSTQAIGPAASVIKHVYQLVLALLGSVIGLLTSLPVIFVIICFCFFFFSWHWAAILDWFGQFIPNKHRAKVLDVAGQMDRTVAGFIRGRLIQSLVMGIIMSIGWAFCGVPYWLLLGIGCGLLNLVPFLAVIGWATALTLVSMDHLSAGHSWSIWLLIWPTVVYLLAQSFDGWVVEPLVQGKATDLDPLSVMLAVFLGGAMAGMLGMLLAIPVAACIKILSREIFIPYLRTYIQKIDLRDTLS